MPDYAKLLNEAQYRVVTAPCGPMLVIAGAGTGKTRTIVFRLAWLAEHGVDPSSILLLTFTRKAAREMLDRASQLLETELSGVSGGTFHAFAWRMLHRFRPDWLGDRQLVLLDGPDQTEALHACRDAIQAKKNRSFPRMPAAASLFSRARNREMSLKKLLEKEDFSLLQHLKELEALQRAYTKHKRDNGLLDYDDLLFELENVLRENPEALAWARERWRHILVDEYQDTNRVQARLVFLLAGNVQGQEKLPPCRARSLMAVGDEAQSIYAFRGAEVKNIFDFPKLFPGTLVVPLEKNYRSVQPVLNVANTVMRNARQSSGKQLRAVRKGGGPARLFTCRTDSDQALCVARRLQRLLEDHRPSELAVLFRAGYQSYLLEMALSKLGIPFRKYGGLRYQDASHIKDMTAYLRLIVNPRDWPAFLRVACLHEKVGPKTAEHLFAELSEDGLLGPSRSAGRREFAAELEILKKLREEKAGPAAALDQLLPLYEPFLPLRYPEDASSRRSGLQELRSLAALHEDLELFLADLALDSLDSRGEGDDSAVVLSTIHSAKGLEWDTVMILDLVEGRFPISRSIYAEDSLEEERRLMYVACTRAKNTLELYTWRDSVRQGYDSMGWVQESQFLRGLKGRSYVERLQGDPDGVLHAMGGGRGTGTSPETSPDPAPEKPEPGEKEKEPEEKPSGETGDCVPALRCLPDIRAGRVTRCLHRMFGEGKILECRDGDILRVDFPLHGQKLIMAAFLFVRK